MSADFRSIRSSRQYAVCLAFSLLSGCSTLPDHNRDIDSLHLFGNRNVPRFSFYFTCAGEVTAETDMCWVASKYFLMWANDRLLVTRQLNGNAAFDGDRGVPADQLAKADTGFDYRIFVRFAPVAIPSEYDLVDGRGGYRPPKAGYKADLYVYAAASDKLIMQTGYHRKSDAAYRGDAIPYVKNGVREVVAALDPGYVPASASK
jgi:hypothetical protein